VSEREERLLAVITDDDKPDMDRALCAVAYLNGASTMAVAELLEWEMPRAATALAAAQERGFADR